MILSGQDSVFWSVGSGSASFYRLWSLSLCDFASLRLCVESEFAFATRLPAPYILPMFDTITAELTTAAEKLAHLRRFL